MHPQTFKQSKEKTCIYYNSKIIFRRKIWYRIFYICILGLVYTLNNASLIMFIFISTHLEFIVLRCHLIKLFWVATTISDFFYNIRLYTIRKILDAFKTFWKRCPAEVTTLSNVAHNRRGPIWYVLSFCCVVIAGY